ncbi:hypothetical protein CPU12_02225 [Malaciobacter molluscorum LMG 25693]|uniref:Uncharacterized protein n=1 Tax=Malaciobacter molluscorum LMG 25693 TaxID=870501 RepID=A0A2G1DKN8_9BACT|nr:DsrE family protein [Malaciobacter molluscorum]AXX92663.1 hypothetical protein AMOL_1698 [Malaciobacter molluscorum LMG 25693]PHO19085.1 hypothetical protein CPU12_02225 [Malaciobacter molluscorum LMG 25693]
MKLIFSVIVFFILGSHLYADNIKGLNVLVTSKDSQTQMMSMVLSMMSLKQKKDVNIVLCSDGGNLALKNFKGEVLKPMNKTPKMMLQALIKKGANVKVCPLFLPNKNMKESDLIQNVLVAKPMEVAKLLLKDDFKNLTF